MSVSKVLVSAGFVLAFAAGFMLKGAVGPEPVVHAAAADRVFEMRTYIASAGRFDAMKSRFRDHTIRFFNKYNMTGVGYWTPIAATPGAGNTLVYILAHESREAATKSWAAFNADRGVVEGRAPTRWSAAIRWPAPIRYFLEPVDFSPIK